MGTEVDCKVNKTANPPSFMERISLGSDHYKTIWNDEHTFFVHIEPQPIIASAYRAALFHTLERRRFPNPSVLVSGGLDSELAAVAVHEYGLDYRLVHMEFRYDRQLINSHERYWAERLAKLLGKSLEIISLDIGNFFKSDQYIEYAKPYLVRSPQLATHIWALSQIKGPTILGGNLTQQFGMPTSKPSFYGVHRYWHQNNQQGIELLQDSYELYALSLQLPKTVGLEANRTVTGMHKAFLFNSWGFTHCFEERPKHTGFELIQQLFTVRGDNWNKQYRIDTLHKLIPALDVQYV